MLWSPNFLFVDLQSLWEVQIITWWQWSPHSSYQFQELIRVPASDIFGQYYICISDTKYLIGTISPNTTTHLLYWGARNFSRSTCHPQYRWVARSYHLTTVVTSSQRSPSRSCGKQERITLAHQGVECLFMKWEKKKKKIPLSQYLLRVTSFSSGTCRLGIWSGLPLNKFDASYAWMRLLVNDDTHVSGTFEVLDLRSMDRNVRSGI